MKHLLVVALVALPLVAFAGRKEKRQAQKHIQAATEAHQAEKYDVALTELEAAYALDPQPDLLYALGQVHVKLGECDKAIESYEKFLATNPPEEPTAAANEAIDTCKEQIAAQTPPPAPEPAPQPAPPAPPPQPEGRPFYTDIVGSALVGGGLVSSVVGIVMYTSARSTLDDAEAAPTYSEHERLVGDAQTKRNIGVVFGAVGVAAIGVGVWHWMKYRSESSVTVAPTASGGMVSWMRRF
jgi:tetratricopeptide (TPR) repeat protein